MPHWDPACECAAGIVRPGGTASHPSISVSEAQHANPSIALSCDTVTPARQVPRLEAHVLQRDVPGPTQCQGAKARVYGLVASR